MKKSPDKFAQMVQKAESWHDQQSMWSIERWAASLLRRQHQDMLRMVRKLEKDGGFYNSNYLRACRDLRAKLEAYRKSTP